MRSWFSSLLSPPAAPRPAIAADPVAPRYPAVQAAACLGWYDGPEFRTAAARLVEFGARGAVLHAAGLPTAEGPCLWVRLSGSQPTEWYEVDLDERHALAEGVCSLRVSFPGSVPYDFFKLAYSGDDLAGRPERVSPEFHTRLWR